MKPEAQNVDWEVLPPEERRQRAHVEPVFRWVAVLMDGLLKIPGTRFKLGLNPIIDLVPGVGDISAAVVSTSVLLYALRHGLPKRLLARMGLNIFLNETVGIVPVLGSAFAFWFRANHRNYELLRRHAAAPQERRSSDTIFVVVMIAAVLGVILLGVAVSVLFFHGLLKLLLGH